MTQDTQTPDARFWSFVDRRGDDDCWTWKGARVRGAYGRFWTGEREVKAHRYSYEIHTAAIPPGLQVLHRCDNPPCVNPAHLFVGTHDDNMADKLKKGRNAYGDKNGSRTHPERRPRGETSPIATLTDAQGEEIYRLYHRAGRGQVELARQFGVSQSLVSLVVRAEKRWKWLAE